MAKETRAEKRLRERTAADARESRRLEGMEMLKSAAESLRSAHDLFHDIGAEHERDIAIRALNALEPPDW